MALKMINIPSAYQFNFFGHFMLSFILIIININIVINKVTRAIIDYIISFSPCFELYKRMGMVG